jgi:apyrase
MMPLSCKLTVALALLIALAQVRGQESSSLRRTQAEAPSQVLVFDAGSSGTRIHVFNFLPPEKDSSVPRIELSVRDAQTKKVKPGLSAFAEKRDYAGVGASIEELLQFSFAFVPLARRPFTPVLLKATAGLRAVKPAEKAESCLERVRDTIKRSGYLFRPEWADIIKGKEEAGLAWVAANYLQGSFTRQPSRASSLGVIEMGGGSTQVTFEVSPQDSSLIGEIDKFDFNTVDGPSYHLYAHSYLGFGQDYAQAKMMKVMTTAEVEDPCYPVGYLRQSSDDPSRVLQGTGNAEQCQELIKTRLLSPLETAAPGRYAGELSLRGGFVATENFFYVRNGDTKLPLDGDLAVMKDAANVGCNVALKPSVELEAAMRAGTADPAKQKTCFALSYQAALLEVLRASTLPGVQVKIARSINGGDIDWALGAALVHFIESGMAKAGTASGAGAMDAGLRFLVVLLGLIGVLGTARFFVGQSCSKQVTAVSSAVRATTFGANRWIEVATKGSGETRSPAE